MIDTQEKRGRRAERAMTSGEGGYQGGQQGDPGQSWNAPPAPPAQYPGYAPAPSAPTGFGAPPALERPVTVRAGLGAFIATLVLSVVGSVIVFATFDDLLSAALTAQGLDPEVGAITEDVARTALVAGVVFALLITALQAMFIWFAWNGRNWARIVLWVLGGLGVASGLVGFVSPQPGYPGYLLGLNVFTLLLTIAGIVLLAMKPSNEWYKYRGWLRATGQGR
jgi:hypothetical protein